MSYEDIIGANYDIVGQDPYNPYDFAIGQGVPGVGPDGNVAVALPYRGGPGPWWPYGYGAPLANVNYDVAATGIATRDSKLVAPRLGVRAFVELLGYPVTKICPGECVTIFTKPVSVLTKIRTLVIPSPIAFNLLLHSFKCGKFEMNITGDPVPCAMFIEQASNWIKFNSLTLNTGVTASLTVENTSNSIITFSAGHDCDVVE